MWYKTGTASFTNGSASVVGVGTDWITGAAVGEAVIAPDGRIYEIGAVTSATGLTIIPAYLGSNTSGAAYTIAPTQAYIRDLATEVAELVNRYANVANGAGQGKFPDGSVIAPGIRFTADENTGLRRLSADTMALVAGGVDGLYVGQSFVSTPHPLVSGVAQTITDWNAVTGTGWYMGDSAANSPALGWFIGYSVVHTPDWITQEVWAFANNDENANNHRYRREKNNGVWGAWFQVYGTHAEIHSLFNQAHTFSGGKKRFENNPASAAWDSAQVEAYTPAGAAVDFSRIAFHVQDAASAPQFGYHYGLGRFGLFDTTGNALFTTNAAGGDLQASGGATFAGLVNAPELRAIGTSPYFSFTDTDAGTNLKHGRWVYADGSLFFEVINDAYSAVISTPLAIDAAGGVTVRGGIMGYGVGSGGSVTQVTSKSTAVTLNKPSGVITCHAEALAAGQQALFIVSNSYFTQADAVVVGLGYRDSVANVNDYEIGWAPESNGSFVILLKNRTGATLANAVSVAFSIIKGSTS